MGNLKGTALPRDEYLSERKFRTKHPIRWKIREWLRKIIAKIDKENDDLYYPNK